MESTEKAWDIERTPYILATTIISYWASWIAQWLKKKKSACQAGEADLIPGLGRFHMSPGN